MSQLTIYKTSEPSTILENHTEEQAIQKSLAEIGVKFERWNLTDGAANLENPTDILLAYQDAIEVLKKERGFTTADVVAITPETPNHTEFRNKFLSEHTHSDDEARFFVGGSGLFYINAGEKIYAIVCEKKDLINVPAGAKHWFDMGPNPAFQCVRVFTNKEGWVAEFTGSDIADHFPKFEN